MARKKKIPAQKRPKPIIVDREFWLHGEGLPMVKRWLENNLYDKQIAENIGIDRTTLYRWRKENEEFNTMFINLREEGNIILENAAFKAAIGYEVEEEVLDLKGNIRKIKKQVPPNGSVTMFMLKNRMPKKYMDKRNVEVEGRIPIVLTGDNKILD